jgi:TPR repeat protein
MLFAFAAFTTLFLQNPAVALELVAQVPSPRLTSELPSRVDCSREPQLKSPSSSQQVTITVTNNGSAPVKVYWIAYEGGRKLYRDRLLPGSSHVQPTYAGHLWVVADEADRCLQIITAENKAEITLTPNPAPPPLTKPDSTHSSSNIGAGKAGESPFVDIVQFRNQPARHPIANEHGTAPHQIGRPQPKMDYALGQFVSIIDRALNNNGAKLILERSPNGKWIPVTVNFTAQDSSFATPGLPYLGRIIASKPSQFMVTLSEDGLVTGKQTGSTDDLRGSGLGYPPTGTMSWTGTETLDLNTGLDNWTFDGQMDAHHNWRTGGGGKGTLTASDSQHRDFTVVPGIDESRTRGDVNVASDPGNARALIIGDPKLRNSTGASILHFSDHAVLSVPLVNRAGLDLNDLRYTVTTTEKTNGILDQGKLSSAFRIARDAQIELLTAISTGFDVPAGGLNIVVTIGYRNTVLGRKTLMVPTEPFYRDIHIHLPATAPRLLAVAKYFGTGGVASGDPAPELAAAAGHDPLAAMWEAVFYSQGVAGYTFDREKAYHVARQVLPQVEERARNGDAEGLYLLFYACQLGVEGEDAEASAGQFLDRAASAGFLPAKFDRARGLAFHKDYGNATTALKDVYDTGVKKAAVILGRMYERGFGVERDPKAALRWYQLGTQFGDPEAQLGLASLTATGIGDTPPDAAKAMQLARQAAARRYSAAYLFVGQAYASGRQGVKQDPAAAIKALTAAAELGDRQAMLNLGESYMGKPGFTPDERAGVFWIRKAAERESPEAMVALSQFYKDGTKDGTVEKDMIAARYWYNQAALRGFVAADNRGLEAQRQSFLDFWNYADFSPSYVYVNRYGDRVGDSGDEMLNGFFSGLFGAMTSYYGNQQTMINGLELMEKRRGKKIYGGTVSSPFSSKLQLKAGETVSIRAYGIILAGLFGGAANADGLGSQWPEYRIVPNFSTSALIAKIGDSQWQFVGTRAHITASKGGPLAFALNAVDYRNYKGYFDVVVEIPDEETPER